MSRKLALRPSYHVEVAEPEGVFLLSEREHVVLQGRTYCQLAPLLDSRLTADEIVERLADDVSPAEVYYAIERLGQAGHLVDGDVTPTAQSRFWDGLGLDPPTVERRLGTSTIALVRLGEVAIEPLAETLGTLGLQIASDGDLDVVATDDYLHDGLAGLNAAALASGRPWLLLKPSGAVLWIGPLFRPGRTGCWECLSHRLRTHREVESFLQTVRRGESPTPVGRGPGQIGADIAFQLAALEVAKAVASADDGMAQTPDGVVTLDLLTLETARHVLVRRPQCPACGELDLDPCRRPAPPTLGSQPKRTTVDGGHRAATPDETVVRYAHLVSPITGVVAALEPERNQERRFGYVYVADHNLGGRRDSVDALRRWLATSSSGKGQTDAQARASALCEALERHSGMFQGDEIRRVASQRELGADAIHPNACLLFSDRQYRRRRELNGTGTHFNWVPDPLDDDTPIAWSPVWSLSERRFKYLPTEYLYYGVPRHGDARYCFPDSNGNAAGNTLEEAILEGLLELIERDSVSLWWYNAVQRPAVDLDSFDEPFLHDLRRRHREAGRDIWALDLTADSSIPAIVVLSRRIDGPAEQILFGYSAHVDPRIALIRACNEINQLAASSLHLGDERRHPAEDPDHVRWWSTATVANQPYLRPADGPARARADFEDWSSDDLWEDVLRCQCIVEALGLELLVLDQTRPDIGLPVVKVVVPGLRHHYARFGPGRLYDVPVKLGWLDRPLTELQLNPIPMFQ